MDLHENESVPLWKNSEHPPAFSQLDQDLKVDVCVVGAGFAGLTTAYLLSQSGLSVAVLEDLDVASGQSGRSTAQLTYALDHRYYELENLHGLKGARLAAESHRAAITKVKQIMRDEKIECHAKTVSGYLLSPRDYKQSTLQKEFDTLKKIGMNEVELHEKGPHKSLNDYSAIEFPDQLQLNPVRYVQGLANAIVKNNAKIFCKTRAVKFHGGKDAFVETMQGHKVHCASIVVATHSPVNDVVAIHTKQAAYRTYVLAFKIKRGSFADILCWDTLDPYHYVRTESPEGVDYDILIVGGEDHKTGQDSVPSERYKDLEKWTRSTFDMAEEVISKWSGQIVEPHDGLAFLGRNPSDDKNIYIITGDSGNGTTSSTVGAMIVVDQIMNRKNPWEELYSPSRISLRSGLEFMKENMNTALQYADWVQPAQPHAELGAEEGIVYRKGLTLVAAYKDQGGHITELSPICPHLGGIVRWNPNEKSWDCPCHGSRFDCHGRLVEGPAVQDLSIVESGPMAPNTSSTIENSKR